MRPGMVSPRMTGGSKKLSRLLSVPMRIPSGMLTTIAMPNPTSTRRRVLPISIKKFPVETIALTSAKVSHGLGTKVGGKNRLVTHQANTNATIDPTLRPTSFNISLAAAGLARRNGASVAPRRDSAWLWTESVSSLCVGPVGVKLFSEDTSHFSLVGFAVWRLSYDAAAPRSTQIEQPSRAASKVALF